MAIWNLGSINIDHVYRLDHLPAPGETVGSVEYSLGPGGKGANQSVAAARAGAHVVHIGALAAQGDDWVLDRLQEDGVDVTHIARLPHSATGHAIILVDSAAENAIIVHAGANRRLTEQQLAGALSGIGPDDILLIQNETNLQVEAAQLARKAGARVIYSCAPFDVQAAQAMMEHVSVLAVNAHEAAQLAEAIPGDLPVPAMLITKGAEGAEYRDLQSGRAVHQKAFPVTPVDTTGAGDCFAGYFAAELDAGRDLAEALRHAAAASAIKVTRRGAVDAIPEAAEVLDFLAGQDRAG
ncbi:ribokinase [Paracoccus aerodenitrificans]|uniref:ribokinase n=1 Tax=Paracoccus aerodenitrificans TaxID=3017781 RepID=UPI0022EFE0E7|nr:ribokinase [Paracoccus aerodenitrificans]WBU64546.1 ribokinase [Paracoccus aerodenitrificans]